MSAILDIIIFAAIAGFIALRLYSVLGTRNDDEPTGSSQEPNNVIDATKKYQEMRQTMREERKEQKAAGEEDAPTQYAHSDDEPVELQEVEDIESFKNPYDESTKIGMAFRELRLHDANFSREGFIDGAKGAHTMILEAYGQGTISDVEFLLSDSVYSLFESACFDRAKNQQSLSIQLVGYGEAELIDAEVDGSMVELCVRIESDQFVVLRDEAGVVLEGDATSMQSVIDIWRFRKDINSDDPNWKLIDTQHG